jgi:hypothetical protein
MKATTQPNRFLMLLVLTGAVALISQTTVAAECKGMEKAACERQESCSWVDGYTRKDGVKVSSHCRKKGGKKSSSSSKSSSSN